MRSVVLIVTILIYIATISVFSFLLLTVLLAVASVAYYRLGRSLEKSQEELSDHESKLFECVSDLFDGFKEQRLSSARSRALGEAFGEQSAATVAARSQVHLQSWQQFVFGETTFNLMLGLVVFVAPIYSPSVSVDLVRISAAILFMVTPVFGLMQSLAVLRSAEAAAGKMLELEGELASLEERGSTGPSEQVSADFSEIRMEGVEFAFPAPAGEKPFALGPLDVTIHRGETIFVTGGNGAGKSTFIKLLTGLYRPGGGRLTIDGASVCETRLEGYRALIAPVFSDFHLFTRLYGLGEIDPVTVEELLRWMEMTRKAGIEGNRFTRTDLSTGQRKRLALVAALLENKPILVLDEWAADQDSHFRKKFYRELLPELKRRGLTIIAVTHDDRYFDAADRRLHLDEGRLTERRKGEENTR
jgi:putative ATP-binding cassette transporter